MIVLLIKIWMFLIIRYLLSFLMFGVLFMSVLVLESFLFLWLVMFRVIVIFEIG